MAQFTNRDPATPRFWDERFERGFTPWDRGGVPRALRDFVAASATPMVTLIPGCGAAYELAYLAQQGWDAVAIDFSPVAVAKAKAGLGQWAGNVVQADFFSYLPACQPELVYERAFLCALPPDVWPRVAARWADLLAPGGLLAGFFFFDDGAKGPPFGIGREALDDLLGPFFECVEDSPVDDSIAVFAGKERWMVWRRR
jgi:hypothetical protein